MDPSTASNDIANTGLSSIEARCLAVPGIARKLEAVCPGGGAVIFEDAAQPAWGFLVGMIARRLAGAGDARRLWVVCPSVRVQERVCNEMVNWWPKPVFFPELEMSRIEGALPDPDVSAERLSILQRLAGGAKSGDLRVLLLTEGSLADEVPAPEALRDQVRVIGVGEEVEMGGFVEGLAGADFEKVAQVFERGQFAVRGGIVDVFSWQGAFPVRIEWFGDEVESIREFDIDSQGSVTRVDSCRILLGDAEQEVVTLETCIGADDVVLGMGCVPEGAAVLVTDEGGQGGGEDETACHENPLGVFDAGDFVLREERRREFFGQLKAWREDGWVVAMYFNGEGEVERFRELAGLDRIEEAGIELILGPLSRGFTIPAAGVAVLSESEVFGRYQHVRAQRLFQRDRRRAGRQKADELRAIEDGDFVVHSEYGIARYDGLIEMALGEDKAKEEVLVLEFRDAAKLFVPLRQAHLVSRYVGVGKGRPNVSRLGDGRWRKARRAAEQGILDYAAQLLEIQAERQTAVGHACGEDNRWQWEFENSFIYKETPGQITAIEDAKRDMEGVKVMDRLICGDVGFGKTEVAIRAAFKSVMGGKQVGVLVPTTVLAQQHFQTFRERMSDYPVTIELLSRFRSPAEQKAVLKELAAGGVDIVVGTHRLISGDVKFKDLGLVVIDEEQRFGVQHKERFKELFRQVDVLTLSATPIPRTLYLALVGVRDMSTIDTPPPNRYPVETMVCGYDERLIRDAIERERKRGGQVYFLHNRVRSIGRVAERIQELCPGASVDIGHGQMAEGELEFVMQRFVAGLTDVLVCTTIIENGLDIPNANTIVIDRADRFGLADLYQLRGRVGRAQHKAYALLLLPRDLMTVGDARRRIRAIKQYSSLGAGFRIAMRDLEIRGAGNILGTRQSGHIAAVGFELYCQLLKQSIARLSGKKVEARAEAALLIDFLAMSEAEFLESPETRLPAFIPPEYIEDPKLRIGGYREVAEVSSPKDLKALIAGWRDRFGALPETVDNLLRSVELKLAASSKNVSAVEIREDKLMLTRGGDFIMVDGKFPRLVEDSLKLRLREAVSMVKQL